MSDNALKAQYFFSVIIPVYNVERYLEECINSVLQQSFQEFELILVDDGSKDSSGRICDEFQKKDGRISVIHKKNGGLVSVRRTGLQYVRGRYVCFLDSDDFYEKNLLECLKSAIDETDSDMILFKWQRVDQDGKTVGSCEPSIFEKTGPVSKESIIKKLISTTKLNAMWSKCCRYEIYDVDRDYSRYYRIQNAEDLIQSLPLFYEAKTFYYLDLPLYNYRINLKSITHVYQNRQFATLDVGRPMLFEYLVRMHEDTEENIRLFYGKYLYVIWQDIYLLCDGLKTREEKIQALTEIMSYEYVQKAEKYRFDLKMSRLDRIGLDLFYRKKYTKLIKYADFYLFILRAYMKGRNLLVKE